MRGLNLDHLRSFTEVIELGSFSAAAERLGLTQPGVSLQVRQLEKRLGVRLIERVGRRATPTSAGAELLAHARHIDEVVAAALDGMAPHAAGRVGRVRLGTGATACIYLLPPILRDLRRRFPSLEVVVKTGNTPEILKQLEENAIDLALVTLPARGRAFEVTPLIEDEFVAVAAPDGEALPARITAGVLARRPLVLYEPGAQTRRIIDDWFNAGGAAVKPIMELGSVEAIKELVAAGLGCTILPRMAVQDPGQRSRIVFRSLAPKLSRKLGLVLRRDKRLHRGLRETVDALRSAAGALPD